MKIKELRALSGEDLKKKEKDLREDLFKIKFQHGIRRVENTARFSRLRKDIARIQTVLCEKEAN